MPEYLKTLVPCRLEFCQDDEDAALQQAQSWQLGMGMIKDVPMSYGAAAGSSPESCGVFHWRPTVRNSAPVRSLCVSV